MKFLSLVRYAFGLAAASLLVSCGGGGAEQRPIDTGSFSVSPSAATWYAGVKNTLIFAGGRPPFQLTSSEPGVISLPLATSSFTLDIVPNQPGVIDAGLQAGELQVRTVNITVRSAEGFVSTAVIKVGQNFLTGYGMFVPSTTCTTGVICIAGESTLHFDSTFNGVLFAGRQFRIEKIRGPYQFVDPLNTNNQVDAVTVTSDFEGKFTTVIRVASGIPAQVALLKVTDVLTGAYTIRTFTIDTTLSTATLTLIPDSITLASADPTVCGSGVTDVLVFDGKPPYTMLCPDPRTLVSTPTSDTDPGKFTVHVGQQPAGSCLTAVPCVVIDSQGARATFAITTTPGAASTTPPTPITVAPATLTLTCGSSGAVTAVGGSGTYSANSSNASVTAVVSGNTITITRAGNDGGAPPFPTTAVVTVTDGASVASATATVPATCP